VTSEARPGERLRGGPSSSNAPTPKTSRSLARRILDLAGEPSAARQRSRVDALRTFLLLHGATRSWLWLLEAPAGMSTGLLGASAVGLTLAAGLSLPALRSQDGLRLAVAAPRVGALCLLAQLWLTFPLTHNHFFVELYAVVLVALVGDGGGERADSERVVLQSICWLAALVLFHTGFQKLLYGAYWRGELLAFLVGQADRFAILFEPLLSPGDVERLRSHDAMQIGAGPYRVDSLLFRLASNAVWVAEIGLAPLLIHPRTRRMAVAAALLLLLAIQLGAREFGFALLFGGLLLSLLESPWLRRALPFIAALDLLAVLAAGGVLPGADFVRTLNP